MITIYKNYEAQYIFILKEDIHWEIINMRDSTPQKKVISAKLMLHLLHAYSGEQINCTQGMQDIINLAKDMLS